jgi:hypothetical protein
MAGCPSHDEPVVIVEHERRIDLMNATFPVIHKDATEIHIMLQEKLNAQR